VLPLTVYRSGYGALARGEYERAIAEFRNGAASDALVADPAAQSASMTRAVAALRAGRLAEAQSQLEQAAAAESSEIHRVLGVVYWANSEYDKSIGALSTAVRRSPRDERTRLALSRVLSSAGRDADAERALRETLQVLPESALAHWWLTTGYEHVNRFVDARQELEQAAAGAVSGESQLLTAIGRLASAAADFPAAIDALTRAISVHPNDAATHKQLAGAFMQQDRTREAFAEFVAALLIDARDAEAHAGIGQVYLNEGRDADAVEALRRATDLAPTNTEARYALAIALRRVGRTEEAAQHFARVEQAQREMLADRRRSLSYDVLTEEAALRAAEGRFEAAITLYEKALTLRADSELYRRLADAYAKAGRSLDAARARAMAEKAQQ
jgi:tetratricopeptide (TPR) repeat protein